MDQVLEYENLVYALMKKFHNYPFKEDLYQVGIKGLVSISLIVVEIGIALDEAVLRENTR